MLVDLEASVEAAKARFADEEISSRCKLLAADLTQSVPAGRERSEHEWRTLLEAAGFRLAGVFPVGNDVGILEAKRVQA